MKMIGDGMSKNECEEFKVLIDFEMTDIQKANKMIENQYWKLFDTPNKYVKYDYNDMSSDVKTYIINSISQKHNQITINFLINVRSLFAFDNHKPRIKKVYISIEIRFFYDLINSDVLRYVKQLLICPKIHSKYADSFLLMNINNKIVPLYIEFDDYTNNVTLSGGHDDNDRKASDIIKDMFFWKYSYSLIRLKYNEDIFKLLNDMIDGNVYPYYRFYENYFNRRKNLISEE